jgi:P-type conjugative transfer protein TrbJ
MLPEGALDSQFNNLYKGYEKYLELANSGTLNPSEVYEEISEDNRQTILGSLKALGISQTDLEDDVSAMRELQALSSSAEGQKGAIQAANEIALHQTAQLKKLHKTLLVQSQAQMKVMEAEQSKSDVSKAEWKRRNTEGYDINNANDRPTKL